MAEPIDSVLCATCGTVVDRDNPELAERTKMRLFAASLRIHRRESGCRGDGLRYASEDQPESVGVLAASA
jgi:hypothetical protein